MAQWLNAQIVIPENDQENQRWFAEQGGGTLKLPHCNDCDMMHYPPRTMCPDCRSTNMDYKEVSGKGTIHSYFILSQPIHPAFHPHPNTPIVLIELDEQRGVSKGSGDRSKQPAADRALRLVGNIVNADGSFAHPGDVAVNKRVKLHMMDLGDGMGLPQWELSDEPPEGEPWQITAPGAW